MYLCLIDFPIPTLNVNQEGTVLLLVGKSDDLPTRKVNLGEIKIAE